MIMGIAIYFTVLIISLKDIHCYIGYETEYKCEPDRDLDWETKHIIVNFYDFHNGMNMTAPIRNAADEMSAIAQKLDLEKKFIVFLPKFQIHDCDQHVLKTFRDVINTYVIVIDYSAYTGEVNELNYFNAVVNSYLIGKRIGNFLAAVREFRPHKIQLVGHGIGGQIAGFLATAYQVLTGDKLERITAIDPAGPCFNNTKDHIRAGLASYVEVLHCNIGGTGTKRFIGDADFILYLEDGKFVCDEKNMTVNRCHQVWCLKIWLSTVHNPDMYLACSSYLDYKYSNCRNHPGNTAMAGYHSKGIYKGIYYVPTIETTSDHSINRVFDFNDWKLARSLFTKLETK